MPNTGGFDIMLQFKQDIINDILVRVLNESLITNLHLKSPLSRRIDEPLPLVAAQAQGNLQQGGEADAHKRAYSGW